MNLRQSYIFFFLFFHSTTIVCAGFNFFINKQWYFIIFQLFHFSCTFYMVAIADGKKRNVFFLWCVILFAFPFYSALWITHTHTPNHIIVVHLVFNIFITVHFVHCLIYDTYIDLKKGSFLAVLRFFHVFTLKSVFSFSFVRICGSVYCIHR